MKQRFKNRKAFEEIAKQLGIKDQTHHVIYTDPYTKKDSMLLVNNFSRFVKGMLKLSPVEQLEKLQLFKAEMESLVRAQTEAKSQMQAEAIKIENPENNLIEVLEQESKNDDAFKV